MAKELTIALGQYSDAGRKESNQDFHGAVTPEGSVLAVKGICVALADGISSSEVSAIASETAIKSFLSDYYCTSDAWSVKTSAQRVITATNSWLNAQNGRVLSDEQRDRGHVCTFSAIILKSRTAHIFHIGDSRIYRLSSTALEPLTTDHRVVLSSHETYLGRALGARASVEIDYVSVSLQQGDIFILTTDGVYEHLDDTTFAEIIIEDADNLSRAAKKLVTTAYNNGSKDNLTVQVLRVETLPDGDVADILEDANELPPAPLLEPRMAFEGYEILRSLHSNNRSHIYLAKDTQNGTQVALKVPSIDMRGDSTYLKRFMLEEWIARRVNNAHVLKTFPQDRKRQHLYVVSEFIEGQSLAQWIRDNPTPELETVRNIIEQVATGLRAFHRKEMIHQDLRPHNIMIDTAGIVKIIDFGSTWVAGVAETLPETLQDDILGTAQFTAPEYFLGDRGSARSDLFSLGAIAYQMLTGRLPYGPRVNTAQTKKQQAKLRYIPACQINPDIPDWVDAALEKAVQINPIKRYETLSEFIYDIRNPNTALIPTEVTPLFQRNPLLGWQLLSTVLFILVLLLLWHKQLAPMPAPSTKEPLVLKTP